MIEAWIFSSVVFSFIAGWVVGKYGYHGPVPITVKRPRLLAAELMRTNKKNYR